MEKKPYFIKHKNELKPRELVELTDKEAAKRREELLADDLVLVTWSKEGLKLQKAFGIEPLEVEINTPGEYEND